MGNTSNKSGDNDQGASPSPQAELCVHEHSLVDAQLPTPVLAKIDSFARVAMAGIQESTTADSISPFIVPETFSVDSINARGPVDIPTDLASADQQSPKDVNAEDFDLAQTADVPSIFPGAAVEKGVVATKVEEGPAPQARAPLPRITTFGVATNIAFDYPEIAKEVLSLPIGSDAEALLGHKIKTRPQAECQLSPEAVMQTTSLIQPPIDVRSKTSATQVSRAVGPLSGTSVAPAETLPRMLAIRTITVEPSSPPLQQDRSVITTERRSRGRSHIQHAGLQLQQAPSSITSDNSTGVNSSKMPSGQHATSRSPSQSTANSSDTGSPVYMPSSDSEVWRVMLDECRARNAAGLADEQRSDSSRSSGQGADPLHRRRPAVPLPAPTSPGEETSKWNVYSDYRLSQPGVHPSPSACTPPPGQLLSDVWSPLQADARRTSQRMHARAHDDLQYHLNDADDIRLAYDIYPEPTHASSVHSVSDGHRPTFRPSQSSQPPHHQRPAPRQQYAYPPREGPNGLNEELLESVASMRVRTPSQKDVAALAYAHAAKVLRAQGLYATASADRPHPPTQQSAFSGFSSHPAAPGNAYGHMNHRPQAMLRQNQGNINEQHFAQRTDSLPSGPPFSSNGSLSSLADGYCCPPYPHAERRSAEPNQRGPHQLSQEEVTAILTRRFMEAADEHSYMQQFPGPPQYNTPRHQDAQAAFRYRQ